MLLHWMLVDFLFFSLLCSASQERYINLSQGILMWSEANLSIAGGIWMNILIIGNGFDLAHGLPTTYKDFLKFTDKFEEYRLRNEDGDELL